MTTRPIIEPTGSPAPGVLPEPPHAVHDPEPSPRERPERTSLLRAVGRILRGDKHMRGAHAPDADRARPASPPKEG